MLDSICENAQSKRLNLALCLFRRFPVGHYSWKIADLSNPSTINFLFNLHHLSLGDPVTS
ncbi:MAG TPA: hypothetical protein VJ386_12210 [Candidatus Deferrimicrobiaceae bacterium]|nr:hypothetical protein [Candidatus Deferrimicrobiaceae bacterium]